MLKVSYLDYVILDSRILDYVIQLLHNEDEVSPLLLILDFHDYVVSFLCTSCRMECAGGTSAGGGVCTLPEGIAQYEGVPRKS